MTHNDFKLGLNDAAELCNAESGRPRNADYVNAAQACREAVKLRELLDKEWPKINRALGGYSYADEVREELRKALGK